MHAAVLDATGYTLLLSNVITLVILLWKGCKRKKKSPFYVLSASDVFSATLTAIILLVNHIGAGIRLNYKWQNNTSNDILNHTWTIEDKYRFPFLQMHDLREIDLNVTLTCDMKDILMQYGMLLAALTNAFVSLLTFTVQCNLNAADVKQRCVNVTKRKSSVKNTQLEPKENKEESTRSQRQGDINARIKSNVIQRIIKIRTPKQVDKKPTSFLITIQWFVPFLVAGILYFAKYSDMNDVKYTEDIECIFGSNFPMSDFDTFLDSEDNPMIDSITYMTPPKQNYFLIEKLSNRSKPNRVEIDEVVSKVQSIVRNALSYTRDSAKNTGITNFLNTSEWQNLTEDILTNNITRHMKNITNINSTVQGVNSTSIERDVNVHNSVTNIYLKQNSEVPLFYVAERLDVSTPDSLMSSLNSPASTKIRDSYQENAQTHFTSTEESTTRKTVNISFVRNTMLVSNNQIYDEIIKRIQAARVQSSVKNHHDRSVSQNQSAISSLKNYIAKRKPNSMRKDPFSNKNGNRYINPETKQNGSLPMTNECLVSAKFLKLQLFILSFAIYFFPILLSSILQMRGKHMCKSTLAMLGAKTNLTFTRGKKIQHQDSVESSMGPQGSGNDHRNRMDTDAIKKESCRENESIALEADCMVRIFDTIKLSLILCVVLWTPVFLTVLLQVYSCTRAPQWLTNVTFLSAISFGIIRNALNINIIRIQEACSDANAKENRIQPIE